MRVAPLLYFSRSGRTNIIAAWNGMDGRRQPGHPEHLRTRRIRLWPKHECKTRDHFYSIPRSARPSRRAAARRRRVHDLHDAGAARQLRADGHFGGPLAYTPFNVATHLAGPRSGRAALRLSAPEASLQRQVHAGRGPLRSDLLRAVDDHGRGARAEVCRRPGDRRYYVAPDVAMLSVDALGFRRGAGALEDAAEGQRPRRSSAVRAGEGSRHSRAVRSHRIHRRHQRRERRPVGRRSRHGRRQGRVLGHRGRRHRLAEDHRLRRRVRDVRRATRRS